MKRAPPSGAAIVVLTGAAMETAQRLRASLPGARLHGLAGRIEGADETFAHAATHLQALFAAGVPIVGVCAAGILVRLLAPCITEKRTEPPVLAVAADGSTAVPLLGGHAGANRLAHAAALALDGFAAVTTTGDVALGLALDDPPPGWKVANPEAAKATAAALLAGEPVALAVEAGDAAWLSAAPFAEAAGGAGRTVRVTDQAPGPASDLVLHPPVLALGVGCERGADPDEMVGFAFETLDHAGLAAGAVACVVSIDVKADEAAVHALADALDVPARFFPAARLEAETPRLAKPSDVVFREVGCHGVAEGAALAAAGADGALLVEKRVGGQLTCAVARAPGAIEADTVGRPRGHLAVVGIGPGAPAWRTAEAARLLAQADAIVGYGLYLDLIADLVAGKERHDSPMGREAERARLALDLAAEGRAVALVSSGDAGIYALAALVFELLDREDRAAWNRIRLTVAPGVSAFQAAAARIGAPMGHDLCLISLSDLMTPWPTIERRLEAAAGGDFVVALYNPTSKRRRTHLARARDILLAARPAHTPAAVARNLGRQGETVEVLRLDQLAADRVDMLSIVLIGNCRTRAVTRGQACWVYTPRGYDLGAAP